MDAGANDRAEEHWKAFDSFHCMAHGMQLGKVIEVGAGPWTQLKGILHIRSDLVVDHFTIWEPMAKRYMSEVRSCSYRSGTSLVKVDGSGTHSFPVQVISSGGELIISREKFDTVISINVLEHVQDAFKYLTGLYKALRTGGLLIFHDRYYGNNEITQGDLYHPVRIKRKVLDHFLSGFDILFNNCSAHYDGRKDRGYYVLARKR
jgi:SAM-dependent methyltransferase